VTDFSSCLVNLFVSADDEVPLGDKVLHGEVHGLVVLGQELHLLDVDLLKQVVNVDSLDGHGDLALQLGVLLFQFAVILDQLVVVLSKLGFLFCEEGVLGIELGVFHSKLDKILTVGGEGVQKLCKVLLQVSELLLKLELFIKNILALLLLVGNFLHENDALALEGRDALIILNSHLALLVLVLLLGHLIGDVTTRDLVFKLHVVFVNLSLVLENIQNSAIQNLLTGGKILNTVLSYSNVSHQLVVLGLEVHG